MKSNRDFLRKVKFFRDPGWPNLDLYWKGSTAFLKKIFFRFEREGLGLWFDHVYLWNRLINPHQIFMANWTPYKTARGVYKRNAKEQR